MCGSYSTTISYQLKKQPRKQREATIAVRIGKLKLKKPHKKTVSIPKSSVELTVIEAREVNTNFEDPILWRLYTTWPVDNFEQAQMVIEWYRCRWFIEEVFKQIAARNNIKPGEVQLPFRIMLVGGKFGPPVFDIADVLGKEETNTRISNVLNMLG